jgi:hypothetical protein
MHNKTCLQQASQSLMLLSMQPMNIGVANLKGGKTETCLILYSEHDSHKLKRKLISSNLVKVGVARA